MKQKGFAPIIFLVIIAVAVVGYFLYTNFQRPSASNTAEKANWKTYRNAMYGYSLRYPSEWDWKIEEFGRCADSLNCTSVSRLNMKPKILTPPAYMGLDPKISIIVSNSKKNPDPRLQIISNGEVSLVADNVIDKKLVSRHIELGKSGVFLDRITLVKDQYIYDVELSYPEGKEESEKIFDQILATLKFDTPLQVNKISSLIQEDKTKIAYWETYVNAIYGYSVQYPPDYVWGTEEQSREFVPGVTSFKVLSTTTLRIPADKRKDVGYSDIQITVWEGEGSIAEGTEDVLLDNIPAKKSTPDCSKWRTGYPPLQVSVVANKGGRTYFISVPFNCKDNSGVSQKLIKIYNQIFSTFKFTQ